MCCNPLYASILALFPGFPRFSSTVCIQYNITQTQTEELKWGRPGNEATSMLHVCVIVSETLVKCLIIKFELQIYPRGATPEGQNLSQGIVQV